MILGKVFGNVVSTRKVNTLVGYKILIVKKLDENKNETGEHIIAVDSIGAGNGDVVIITTGGNARFAAENHEVPIDAIVVGIVY